MSDWIYHSFTDQLWNVNSQLSPLTPPTPRIPPPLPPPPGIFIVFMHVLSHEPYLPFSGAKIHLL